MHINLEMHGNKSQKKATTDNKIQSMVANWAQFWNNTRLLLQTSSTQILLQYRTMP